MIRVELRKLARRPRTWVSLILLCALPIAVAVFLATTRIGTGGPAFLYAVLNNGSLFPAAALAIVLPLFLPVAVAVIGGDAVAGEASAGMLRAGGSSRRGDELAGFQRAVRTGVREDVHGAVARLDALPDRGVRPVEHHGDVAHCLRACGVVVEDDGDHAGRPAAAASSAAIPMIASSWPTTTLRLPSSTMSSRGSRPKRSPARIACRR